MIALSLAEVAAAVGGRLVAADPDARVTGTVEFDSRKVTPSGLFVAFPGEKVDGHDYAAGAVSAGAVAVLGTREVPGVPMVLVADALDAMGRLARAVVDRLPGLTVIGLTGSSGKTTTKDLIAQLAVRLGPTVAPPGSFNNELGHPYTALQAGPETRYLVMEKGARGVGHIRYLCDVVPPRISVVLNVGVAHIGEFGSVETIALAKGELVEALPADGLAVLNADDPLVDAMAARTRARVVRYGESERADVRAVEVTVDGRGRPSYTLVTPEGSAPVRLGLTGRHQVSNSLAAAAVARELGMPLADLAAALGELGLVSTRRMDVFERADGVTVIDDSYNANPASTAVALRALASMRGTGRTVAVLGYMAELGDFETEGHQQVGRLAAELGVDRLLVVGEPAAPIHQGATAVGSWGGESVLLTDQAAAVEVLRRELRPGDVVLVKGSRYRTWEVADALRAEADKDGAA
ncbi:MULTISPECIES: UDP-N-acetylmuramoyl-tripeptide--D-alanyl-D-alanine ligase [Micromonospora]|uniref:UDP-N-acetylmuramoyl-tripeptide--D-alanyl-D-alanine ligase n=1 Tax=Micromonospora solifontis TaxID=2487138 RepID=A0ABX9WJP8_9ACTN|nr:MULTISPECIES: UDP-N-acetylmuramoyl-tripeptide--D-alanyl-D-alanine ligase [Micromonospora]NES12260.1 UDP-N-acetylmuramoyl-tripeptide--D-alanyl-D-alanine ligase [Micromonospora sp. PPF5-17B]NES36937.1 UDP-N-acetylmuramoyl-tripeptide--D-alanyl-D-alanine ligase [Micromonospora solifontis]NES54257.1 UDP-N-acetylmuramoyl-tripeptide--D-alanyl-D-alanine ligase [Micromonospora sp. PPF5-6]RNL98859.1 UDP-N-acetylmuramoyl-tripeptide--D-alanyl-D-alanine ligase [Micromonospora solifontis]